MPAPGSRPATEADVDWLLALRLDTMSDHFRRAGLALSEADQLARLRQRFDAVRVLTLDGRDVGMIKVVREPALWHLVQVQIAPEAQGAGLGRAVIEDLLADAAEAGVAVSLHVLKVNPARRLYERLGFRICGDAGDSYLMQTRAPGETGPIR